jgi:L-lactate dehydrogenase complex protein LldG
MSSRDNILKRLRQTPSTPFADLPPVTERRVMHPMPDTTPSALLEQFTKQAKTLSAQVYHAPDEVTACDYILKIIGQDREVMCWDLEAIPLPALGQALQNQGITIAPDRAEHVRVGITGVEAALAATGGIVIASKAGRARAVSLLPYVHIAVFRLDQLLPHFDAWIEQKRANLEEFRQVGNWVVISGASRTADIGMEIVLGAHGPADLHLVVLT